MAEYRPEDVIIGLPVPTNKPISSTPENGFSVDQLNEPLNLPGTPGAQIFKPEDVNVSVPSTLPSQFGTGLRGVSRSLLPSALGLFATPFGAAGGGFAGGVAAGPPGALAGAIVGGASLNALATYATAKEQEAVVPFSDDERIAMTLNPG